MSAEQKGHVEIFFMHDENYWSVFLDGKFFDNTHHADFTDIVLRSKNQKTMAKQAAVATDDLRYTVYEDFFYIVDKELGKTGNYYECDDYLTDYSKISQAISAYNITPGPHRVDLDYLESHY